MPKGILYLTFFLFLFLFSTLFLIKPVQADDPQKIHRESVYLQVKDADYNRGGISLTVTLTGKDVDGKEFAWVKTYNNPNECETIAFRKEDPCIRGGDIPDGPDNNGNPPPQLKANETYKVIYEIHHFVNNRVDTAGKVNCRNTNCGPFGNLRINDTIKQADYTFTAPTPSTPTLESSSPELLPGQDVAITIKQLDERIKYVIQFERYENNQSVFSKISTFDINEQLDGCALGITYANIISADNLKLSCKPLQPTDRYNAAEVQFKISHSELLSNDNRANVPPERTYGIRINGLPKYTDKPNPIYMVNNNLNLLFKSTDTSTEQKLRVELEPSTISVATLLPVAISIKGVTAGKKYNVTLGSGIPSYNEVVAQGDTLELTFNPRTHCHKAPCFRATNINTTSSIPIIASDSENPSIFGRATLMVTAPANVDFIPSTTCSKEDIQNGRCGTSRGQTVTGCTDSADNPAIATAIGCIHTNPAEFTKDVLKFVIGISGGLAFLMMLLGAFQMLTSAGNPETLQAGRERLTSAIIGLLLIIFSVLLLQIIGVGILNLPGFGK